MVNKPSAKTQGKDKKVLDPKAEKAAKKKFKRTSEYGRQLEEKQSVKRHYGMRERQFRNLFKKATRMEGAPGEILLSMLERRLDNVVYRLKMATSTAQARQMIVHGHILLNGKKFTIPSYAVMPGDVVTLREKALKNEKFLEVVVDKRMNIAIKVPEWLELAKQSRTGKILRHPVRSDIQFPVEEHLIVELYSR